MSELTSFQRKNCITVITKLMKSEICDIFVHPVSDELQGYDRVVSKKMCLSDVLQNLETYVIKTMNEFRNDTLLIFSNCVNYWKRQPGGEIYVSIAEASRDIFENEYKKIGSSPENDWILKVQRKAQKLEEARNKLTDLMLLKLEEAQRRL